MVEIEGDVREKVKSLLKELFQFDEQDIDFGIYRIMNLKRKAIAKFIEEDLIVAADKQFNEYSKVGQNTLRNEVEKLKSEIIRDFGAGTIDEQGHVRKHEDTPKIQEYMKKVEELRSAEVSEAQMNEVFNHIYEFFSRYYDKGDFISKRRYGGREKYYVPYNGEEVVLHWANKDQYYVKTAEYFRNYSFNAGAYKVNFLLREAQVEVNNVVGDNRYFILSGSDAIKIDDGNKTVNIYFEYRMLADDEKRRIGTRNVQETLVVDAIDRIYSGASGSQAGIELRGRTNEEETVLEKHLNNYVRRNTTDYFIHKNLKVFLEQELEFYIKNEVVDLDDLENLDEKGIRIARAKVKAIREMSKKIIGFLAQIEDFQKMLFEKRKFVVRTDYCMTLDVVPEELYMEIGSNEKQVEEWRLLFKLDETTNDTLYRTIGKKCLDTDFLKSHKNLVLDTKFFNQEFKDRLLQHFDKLDERIDGVLVKSENFQALSLLLNKYEKRIKCIYIDPPYNTGSDEFLYKDNYQHSSWLSMMHNRISLAKALLTLDGGFFVSIDYNEDARLRLLLEELFGATQYRNTIVPSRVKKSIMERERVRSLNWGTGYLLFFSASEKSEIVPPVRPSNSTKKENWHAFDAPSIRPTMEYKLFEQKPPSKRHWMYSEDRALQMIERGELRRSPKSGRIEYKVPESQGILLDTNWTDVLESDSNWDFLTEKNTFLLQRAFSMLVNSDDIILDFFAGSGSTAHAVINKNWQDKGRRKYILVEMGNCFEEVIKPRIKKIIFSWKWKDGLPASTEGISHVFKYLYLEQYEDTLNNITLIEKDKTVQERLDKFQDYFVHYMLDYETRESPARLNLKQFQTPFDYKMIVTVGVEKMPVTVDLVETFNYLLGINVEKFRAFNDNNRGYRVIFGKRKDENIAIIWRNSKEIDLNRDKEFIENMVLAGTKPDCIFINGDSYVKNARPIEPEFKRLMGA